MDESYMFDVYTKNQSHSRVKSAGKTGLSVSPSLARALSLPLSRALTLLLSRARSFFLSPYLSLSLLLSSFYMRERERFPLSI